MFVVHDVLLDVAFGVARPRLVSLASSRAFVDEFFAVDFERRRMAGGELSRKSRIHLDMFGVRAV